jgi:hypothetical protein
MVPRSEAPVQIVSFRRSRPIFLCFCANKCTVAHDQNREPGATSPRPKLPDLRRPPNADRRLPMSEPRDRTLRRKPSLAGFGLPDAQDRQEKQEKDAKREAARTQQRADAPRAIADYRAAEKTLRERTAKLREARLARDAANADKPKE